MIGISPFRAVRPHPFYAEQFLFTGIDMSGEHLVGAVVPALKLLLESGSRKSDLDAGALDSVYSEIKEVFQDLLANKLLLQDVEPCMYIYEVWRDGKTSTGVWTLMALDSYREGSVLAHELTLAEKELRHREYRLAVGLEGQPVLLAYPPDGAIGHLIAAVKATGSPDKLSYKGASHLLWRVQDTETLHLLTLLFSEVEHAFIADGHHRIAAAASTNDRYISSLLMAADQFEVGPFYRMVLPRLALPLEELLFYLEKDFVVELSADNLPYAPGTPGWIGMLAGGRWYHLFAKRQGPGVILLQHYILAPVFGIIDPMTDGRLHYAGGPGGLDKLVDFCEANVDAVGFTVYPLTIDQVMEAATRGDRLPPKSTWMTPKAPYGLVMALRS